MKKIFIILAAVFSLAFAADVEVSGAFIKQTPPNAKNSAIFMTLTNKGSKDAVLIGASSPIAKVAELHTHSMKDGKMMMKQVKEIVIKANSSVALKPGGLHVMLFDLKEQVKADTKTSVKLNFADKTSVDVENIPAKKN